ncbi:MAG: AIR synthase related protein, partial [Candidatus Bipolaricaulaceae bacterium]
MKRLTEERITALHGAGGLVMEKLIAEKILPKFKIRAAGPIGLDQLDDGAVLDLPEGKLVITTDNHAVKPIFFPGGDIGKLAVTGTVNDLVVMGARPVALTMALVLEEGFPLSDLERILGSAAAVLSEIGVALVAGDTKVMGKGE